ncbi:hypothetical protein CALCODRAFT_302996 [Calocera cornea HHB12733]|uniref:Uncharacterized protein n=1 Tax=Calocera cornea HHB12733 TaxID=1353952 RepID=A0A165JJK7_9BASI|nr:hypothetical protein CALCODRAFT_302996 [Calocera cornea HHB12733]
MVFRQFQKTWLQWLCEPGMIELHWQEENHHFGRYLNIMLYWKVGDSFEEVHESGVAEAVRTVDARDPKHEMRTFLELYDAKLKDRAERTASRNERGVWNVEHTELVQDTSPASPRRKWFQQLRLRLNPMPLFSSILNGAARCGTAVEPTEPDVELGLVDGGQNRSAGTSRMASLHKEPTASTDRQPGGEVQASRGVQGAAALVPVGTVEESDAHGDADQGAELGHADD